VTTENPVSTKQRKRSAILNWVAVLLLGGSAVCTALAVLHVPVLPHSTAKPLDSVDIDPAKLISRDSFCLGDPNAKVRLVMFGDYECPPCRASWPEVVRLVKAHPHALAVHFRNFPLTTIHQHAFTAATAAEVAKMYGRFSDAHELLYEGSLPEQDLGPFCKAIGITKAEYQKSELKAAKVVSTDMNFAIGLGMHGTPTFFLVDDSNKVFTAESIEDLRPTIDKLD